MKAGSQDYALCSACAIDEPCKSSLRMPSTGFEMSSGRVTRLVRGRVHFFLSSDLTGDFQGRHLLDGVDAFLIDLQGQEDGIALGAESDPATISLWGCCCISSTASGVNSSHVRQ